MNISFYLHDELNSTLIEQQLLWLKSRYTMISSEDVKEFYYGGKSLKNSCHITIDDGWRSTYDVIFPLLKKHNIPATIFVSPKITNDGTNFWYHEYKGYDAEKIKSILINKGFFTEKVRLLPLDLVFKEMLIDDVNEVLELYRSEFGVSLKERGFVNPAELIEMDKSGLVEIGAHTMTHPILANETDTRSEREIIQSVESLSEILGHKVTTFAYPNGLEDLDFGKRETATLEKIGIELAYTVDPGVLNAKENPLLISRTCSISRLKLGRLGLMLPSLHDQVKPRQEIRKHKIER